MKYKKNSCCVSWLTVRWVAVTLSSIGGGSRKSHPLGHRGCPRKFPGGEFCEKFLIFPAIKAAETIGYLIINQPKAHNKRYKTYRHMDKTIAEPEDIFEDDEKVYSGLLEED